VALILLVDDEPASRWVLADFLSAHGHRCLEASDGQEALHLLRGREVDLVLADVRMPRMDGFRLFEELQPRWQGRIPFVFLSGHAVQDDIDVVLQSGAFGYLLKPCEPTALRSLVDRALESRGPRRADEVPPDAPPSPPATPAKPWLPVTQPSAPPAPGGRWIPRPPAPLGLKRGAGNRPHLVSAPLPPKGRVP
jgi:CheY-like chemotaxis protein